MMMRIKPNFGSTASVETPPKKDDRPGCVRISMGILIVVYFFSAFLRFNTGNPSRLDKIVCSGILLTLIILLIVGSLITGKERRDGKAKSISAEVPIVSRAQRPGRSYQINEYGDTRYARPYYGLTLGLPDQTVVTVEVTEDIYKKLENRWTVRIYYEPDSPSTFLLEGEM